MLEVTKNTYTLSKCALVSQKIIKQTQTIVTMHPTTIETDMVVNEATTSVITTHQDSNILIDQINDIIMTTLNTTTRTKNNSISRIIITRHYNNSTIINRTMDQSLTSGETHDSRTKLIKITILECRMTTTAVCTGDSLQAIGT
jgi:hypothetical protein